MTHEVNEAVEYAFRTGILTSASLMVGGAAQADAVARARRNPGLAIGLHVAVVDADPVLDPSSAYRLVDRDGRLLRNLVQAAVRFAFDGEARAQLKAEIDAQFRHFMKLKLPLDHVNTHHHMQFHPVVFRRITGLARKCGAAGFRIPAEPISEIRRNAPSFSTSLSRRLMRQFALRQRRHLRCSGFVFNDALLGISGDAGMGEDRLLQALACLPEGLSEIYCHPTTDSDGLGVGKMDLAALVSPRVRAKLSSEGIERTTYGQNKYRFD